VALFGGRQRIENEPEVEQTSTSSSEPTIRVPKQPVAQPSPPAPSPTPRERAGARSGENHETVIGSGITIKGELLGDEDVKIEGRVEGKIQVSKNLLVGQDGVIEADLQAENINIGGTVTGNVVAQSKVEIFASGKMTGDIKAPRVVVAEGAHFKGNVDMDTSHSVSRK
jgi:cytoskeletal protein CcmA (bactofilin family)